MKEGHVICKSERGCRWFLGKNIATGKATWISEWLVTKPMVDVYPLVYKKREYAEASAEKIRGGAFVITLNQ